MNPATVYLIGAGPGDPSLITVRGQRRIEEADVVIHDHLVHRRLIETARPDAERIDVGAAAPEPGDQDAINILLADKAREGRTVARLKWGDPFLFAAGGKEALFLHEHGIPFEVVPGVPAAPAGAAFAGIPLTYPEAGDTLIFIRGQGVGAGVPPDVDWSRVAALPATVVSHASIPQIGAIVDALLAHGRSPEEPAALVTGGTLPRQRTSAGTLGELRDVVQRERSVEPALLVAGAVVGLRQYLRWFDARPLFGKRVLVTRAREQAGDLVDRLSELGADPIEAPAIRTVPPEDPAPIEAACAAASSFDWIVFTSANAVDAFMDRLLAGPRDARALGGVRLCAVGPATASRLARRGLHVDLVPAEHRAEAVSTALGREHDVRGARILLPRADLAGALLPKELRRAGAEVVEVTAYRTVPAPPPPDVDVYRLLLDQGIDVVTFTSASAARNLVKSLGEEPAADLLGTTLVACIGPVTAEAARQLGIETAIMPSTYTAPALAQAIADYFATHRD